MSSTLEKPPLKPLTPQEWELLIDEFQQGQEAAWTSRYSTPSILEHALSSLLRRDSPLSLKHSLILFMEEFSLVLFQLSSLGRLMDALRSIVQAPLEPPHYTYALKEQMMVSTTSIFITLVDDLGSHVPLLEGLVELLLVIINRPNHGTDRQTRGIACECLRELEKAYPCLLSDIAGHLWSLCQSERTHASQSYILLFTQVVHNITINRVSTSILNTSIPLIPFNVPQWVLSLSWSREVSALNYKELRRAMAFLLEWPLVFTPCGMMEFMGMIMPVAMALELQPSMLKVQFFGMMHSYNPLLCHVVLGLYLYFFDAFDGQEVEIARRLVSISREVQIQLVFRLLALQWLLGFFNRLLTSDGAEKKKLILGMALSFYPTVFDPLALKALKLDLLALFSICLESSQAEGEKLSMRNVFEKGLVSVSAFKWMPPWSTETAVAFRTFHKFLIDGSSHSDVDSASSRKLTESAIFHSLQEMLVDLTLEFPRLVPVVVAFTDRFMGCQKHHCLGEGLLQTLDENLLPKVTVDYKLVAYFPLFDKIAESDRIPPRRLLELLKDLMVFIVKKYEPDGGWRSWSQGSKALGICRTMMMHHNSSRLFVGLSRLLAFACLYFPDLEVRDNARIYLRMLVCVPGKKLRELLNLGDKLIGVAPSAQSDSFFNVQSPRRPHDPRRSRNVSAYVQLQRVKPLLAKQSWSLSLSTLGFGDGKPDYLLGIKDNEPKPDEGVGSISDEQTNSESERVQYMQEPLRVMDAKISQLLEILRLHFSCIPDFRHMLGIKVRIPCFLSFKSEPFICIWGGNAPDSNSDEVEALPAMYATVVKFSSSAPYGSIPSCHIPFLMGEPSEENDLSDPKVPSEIVPFDNGSHENNDSSRALVVIELEPREPTPGLVDVFLETNAENGQIIRGRLHSVTVGIEDMFLKAITPSDTSEEATPTYYSDLFSSLWEACGSSANFGHEIFPLQGGKGVAVISGTQSVKLLEVSASSLIHSTERHLAPFVVSVTGDLLVDLVRDGGIIQDVVWKDAEPDLSGDSATLMADLDSSPLALKYIDKEDEIGGRFAGDMRRSMGYILILIFLPPRFHLLLQMEVGDMSTLVRIRTDHWPCLAYIDDYLEALYLAE